MAGISPTRFATALEKCASLPDVRHDVLANHDNNRWWPRSVKDWRLRMMIAGLGTRVSYAMLSTHEAVVSKFRTIGYTRLTRLPDDQLAEILGPLARRTSRKFCASGTP